ncbi:MAG: hypothetical protein ACRD4O_16625 [Bryobacteraceae bacterium]
MLIDVAVLAGFIFLLLCILSQARRKVIRYAAMALIVLFCLFAIYRLQNSINPWLYSHLGNGTTVFLRIAVLLSVGIYAVKGAKRIPAGLRNLFLVLSPMIFVMTAQAFWFSLVAPQPRFGAQTLAGMLPATHPNRAIWIIFDELDKRMLFDYRPARIQLPHFDALRGASLFGDRVQSPARNTESALPSLLLSKRIPRDEDMNLHSRPIEVRFSGCPHFVKFSAQRNIFRRARALGLNTAVSGWYHPYCQLFGADLSACSTPLQQRSSVLDNALDTAEWEALQLPNFTRHLAWLSPLPLGEFNRRHHRERLNYVLENAEEMLRNQALNLVVIHLPTPHPPGIWDASRQTFTTSDRSDYIDNLALADEVLAEIEGVLRENGGWNKATILVSTDHPYRPAIWLKLPLARLEVRRVTQARWQPYIPFFLKLPGQKTGVAYHREFNSVLSGNLLLAALQGKIRTPAQAVQWLDAHAAGSEEKVCR